MRMGSGSPCETCRTPRFPVIDSAVFIQAGSFPDTFTPPTLAIPEPPSSTLGLGMLIAIGLMTSRNRNKKDVPIRRF